MIAVTNYGPSLYYASEDLRIDKEVVTIAVAKYGYSLGFASEEPRNDKEVVTIAVTNCGLSLQVASEELRNDKEVVTIAVRNNGGSLQYASEGLRNDKEVVKIAALNNGYLFASEELNDEYFLGEILDEHGRMIDVIFRCSSERIQKELKNDRNYLLRYASKLCKTCKKKINCQ